MTGAHVIVLFWPIGLSSVAAIPAFVVGQRLGVVHAGEAFIPAVGPLIVILHSIRRSGWLCILGLIPYVGLIFLIWLACVIPGTHGRTRWWILAFLIPGVNIVAFFGYAFSLPSSSASGAVMATP